MCMRATNTGTGPDEIPSGLILFEIETVHLDTVPVEKEVQVTYNDPSQIFKCI